MPRPVQKPPALGLEEVTNGYVPKSMSSSVAWPPSRRILLPARYEELTYCAPDGIGAVGSQAPGRGGGAIEGAARRRTYVYGVLDVRPDSLRVLRVLVHLVVEVPGEARVAEALDAVVDQHRELLAEAVEVPELADADAVAQHLGGVGRADAALGGADLVALPFRLAQPVELLVEVEEDLRPVADEQPAVEAGRAALAQAVNLVEELRQVHHDAVAHDVHRARIEHAARQQVQRVLLPGLVDDRVAGVRAALTPRDDVVLAREDVHQLALPLVAPLRAEDPAHLVLRHGRRGRGGGPARPPPAPPPQAPARARPAPAGRRRRRAPVARGAHLTRSHARRRFTAANGPARPTKPPPVFEATEDSARGRRCAHQRPPRP